jgi:hypothetical protein
MHERMPVDTNGHVQYLCDKDVRSFVRMCNYRLPCLFNFNVFICFLKNYSLFSLDAGQAQVGVLIQLHHLSDDLVVTSI